jgi:hypothetical protein
MVLERTFFVFSGVALLPLVTQFPALRVPVEEVLDVIFASVNLYQFDAFGTHLVAASV